MVTPRLKVRGLQSLRAGPFDFSLLPGECLAVTGPSGAGKSLLLRMIADLDPHQGDAFLDGRCCAGMPAPSWRRSVVFSAAESGWWLDEVGAHFAVAPVEMADALGLPADIFSRSISLCSTGERQRLAFLRAMAANPKVLLLDEPTSALDAHAIVQLEDLLQAQRGRGTAVVMVTHDPSQAARLATRQIRIEHGKVAAP
jgi:ABC-type multidrug transport system ATPase subunit